LKILVTGANGFIGKHLCIKLKEMNINFIPYSIKHDKWESSIFSQYLEDGITHVVHLAAKNFVPESWTIPEEYIKTNVNSTISLLEFCRKIKAKFIFISSYMYGNPHYLPIDENHPTAVLNPYALSKFLAEESCKFYAENLNVSSSVLRVFNIYGPGQKDIFLIPHVISQILNSDTIEVLDLEPKRDYLYVSDLIDAIISLFQVDFNFEIFNVGSGVSCSVGEIIEILQKIAKTNKVVSCNSIKRVNEISNVYASNKKLMRLSGWEPKVSLQNGLKKCLDDF
jgi:nucleoside-diphosphate-sugar epimerase